MNDHHFLEIDSFYCDKRQLHFKQPYKIRLIRGPNFLVLEDPELDLLISERTYRKARKSFESWLSKLMEIKQT